MARHWLERDSEIVAHVFDERDAAVATPIAQVVRTGIACGRKIGICGQAPSDWVPRRAGDRQHLA